MLYNPEWDKRPILDQWIDWLETKDPDEKYEWRYEAGCACGQFYGGSGWRQFSGFTLLNSIARGATDRTNPADWTFGRCLARAKHYREWQRYGWFTS